MSAFLTPYTGSKSSQACKSGLNRALVMLNTLSDKIPWVSLLIKVKKMLNGSALNFNELARFNSTQ